MLLLALLLLLLLLLRLLVHLLLLLLMQLLLLLLVQLLLLLLGHLLLLLMVLLQGQQRLGRLEGLTASSCGSAEPCTLHEEIKRAAEKARLCSCKMAHFEQTLRVQRVLGLGFGLSRMS